VLIFKVLLLIWHSWVVTLPRVSVRLPMLGGERYGRHWACAKRFGNAIHNDSHTLGKTSSGASGNAWKEQ
jgi:hypothetical protein